MSRAAGLALTKALSKELGPDNITVNAILIGLVESGQWRRRAEATGADLAEVYTQMNSNAAIPLGRIGTAEEFADLGAFLVSDRARYISGGIWLHSRYRAASRAGWRSATRRACRSVAPRRLAGRCSTRTVTKAGMTASRRARVISFL